MYRLHLKNDPLLTRRAEDIRHMSQDGFWFVPHVENSQTSARPQIVTRGQLLRHTFFVRFLHVDRTKHARTVPAARFSVCGWRSEE